MGSCVCFNKDKEPEVAIRQENLKGIKEKTIKPTPTSTSSKSLDEEFSQIIESLALNSESIDVILHSYHK